MPRVKPSPRDFDLGTALAGVHIDRAQPIARQLYRALRRRIVDSRLPAGTPIHESDVAAHCRVSRTPLRAALQQLANEGLVVTRPQVGSIVAERDRTRFLEALFIRSAIEGQVVRRLAGTGLDEDVIGPVMRRQERAVEADDHAVFFEVDEEFHELLAEMAGVPGAWQLAQTVKAHVDRERFILMSSIRGRMRRAFGDHLRILDAIRAGDSERAAVEMVAHIETVLQQSDGGPGAAGSN